MQQADFSVLGTYVRHYRGLLRLLGMMDLPLSSAVKLAGDEALKRCAFTPLVTSIALNISTSGLKSLQTTPIPASGLTPEAGESPNLSQDSRSSESSPTLNSSPALTKNQGANRKQRRAQQLELKRFLKSLRSGSALRTLSIAGKK